jgi:hypothetical protein
MKYKHLKHKALVLGIIILGLTVCGYEFLLPDAILWVATTNLRHIQTQQAATFTAAIEALGVTNPQNHFECGTAGQTHWRPPAHAELFSFTGRVHP